MELSEETQIELMKKDITFIKDDFANFKKESCERHEELLAAIERIASSKANKWVEEAMKWGIYGVIGAVGVALLALIIK